MPLPAASVAGPPTQRGATPRRNRWDLVATALLIIIGAPVAISVAILLIFTVAWGSYGASLTGDQSWVAAAVWLGILVAGFLGGIVWSIVRLVRRKLAFTIMLTFNALGVLTTMSFGVASGDVTNVFAWLFPVMFFAN